MNQTKYILWDWNGTLLNDVEDSISCINEMLRKRDMKQLDYDSYREIFTFPVIDYYREIGFDFDIEPFSVLAVEFISIYREKSRKSPLHNDVLSVLNHMKTHNKKQLIVSAMEQNALEHQTHQHRINHFFERIVGLDNIHAKSKIDNARALIENEKMDTENCVVIGDTYHDFEVADQLGTNCILINNGHQNLKKYDFNDKVTIVNRISDVLAII